MRSSAADGKSVVFRFILVASMLWCGSFSERHPSSSDIEYYEVQEALRLSAVNSLSLTDTTEEVPSEVNSLASSVIDDHRWTSLPGPGEDGDDDDEEETIMEFVSHYNSTTEVDLVFVLDRSGSVPRKKWDAVIQFVKNILKHFTVDKDNTRVAVVTYSTTVNVDFDDLEPTTSSDEESMCTVSTRLNSILTRKLPHGYTATYDALVSVYKSLLNSRPTAKKAVLVITDGKSNIGPPPLKAAVDILSLRWQQTWDAQLLGPQVEIFVFGVDEVNPAELRTIASSLSNHVFMMSTFRQFAQFAKKLHGGKQQQAWALTKLSGCGNTCNGLRMVCVCATHIGQYQCTCEEGYEMIHTYCRPCKVSFYNDNQSPDRCKICPENMTTLREGATSISDCVLKPGFVVCPSLPDVEHASKFFVYGTVTDEVANKGIPCNHITDGNSCHYECDDGYRLTGSPVMICNYSGSWDGTVPSCKIIDCHRIEQFYEQWAGMTVNYLNHSTTYNAMVDVTCRSGTVPSSQNTVWTCDSQGQWSSSWNFHCREIFCGPLVIPDQARVSPAICETARIPVDTHCHAQCAYGYRQSGPSDFLCFHGNGTPLWSPDAGPACTDVQPPKITCPDDVSLMVADWGARSTIFHYDNNKPQVSDNSGHVWYEVRGVPDGKNFPIGSTELIYEAADESGNNASCTRIIHISERSVNVQSCPSNITATVTTLQRTAHVSWPRPVFLGPGGNVMPFTCTTENNRDFHFGVHTVICFPDGLPRIECKFMVNVADAPCTIPYQDRAPQNGALICASSSHPYPKVCRIHCRENYELRNHESRHKFVCRWDGSWNLEGDRWPECMRTRRPSKLLTDNQLFVRFSGACSEAHENLSKEFTHTITKVLESEYGACPAHQTCKVEDVQVHCGEMTKRATHLFDEGDLKDGFGLHVRERHRRAASRRRTIVPAPYTSRATIRFQLSAQVARSDEVFITQTEQRRLLDTLDDIFYNISDLFADGQLKSKLGVSVVDVSSLREIRRHFNSMRCSRTEIEGKDDLSAICYTCPPGSRLISGNCQLCPLGTYQPSDAGSRCLPCPSGTTTKSVGARVLGECTKPCRPGHFSESGLETCEPCAKGSFQDSSGSKLCKKCPNGRQTLSVGSTNEEDCVDLVDCQSQNMRCKGGICYEKAGHEEVQCFCPIGARSCQSPSAFSDLAPCLNNGSYKNLGDNNFVCQCPTQFTGEFCEVRRSICESSPCVNGGSCLDHGSHFLCLCPSEFSGDFCESTVPKADQTGIGSYCMAVDSNGNCIHRSTADSPDFDIIFNTLSSPCDHHIRWSLESSLRSLTMVMWLRSSSSISSRFTRSTIVSFRTPSGLVMAVDLSYSMISGAKLQLDQTRSKTSFLISLPRDSWHQIIVDWTALTGFWRVFVNESFVDEVHVPSSSDFVTAGSSLTLAEAFDGELSQFAFYDHLLPKDHWTDAEESHFVGKCHALSGNVLQWTDVLHHLPNNSVAMTLRHGTWCLDTNECLYPSVHKCRVNEMCVDKRGTFTCQPCDPLSSDVRCTSSSRQMDCFIHKCQNNGICGWDGLCICPSGYSGTFCENYSVLSESCISNPCLNGGECLQEGSRVLCRCRDNWTGRLCQVSYTPSCQLNPCVNNGSCVVVVQPDWTHYNCLCPDLGRPLGTNCEFLAICDTLPCLNGGTCVNLDNESSYECMCHANYVGQNCETPISLLSPMVPQRQYNIPSTSVGFDFCRTVECHNGGSCRSTADGFICKCLRDYKGQYCDEQRSTETMTFQVTMSLLLEYDSRLHYDTAFQESFRLQIHQLFGNQMTDSKLYVVINDIRRGNSNRANVLMDFKMIFTFYLDSVVLGTEAVRQILVDYLLEGKLGSMIASFDDFSFNVIPSSANLGDVSTHRTALYTTIIVLMIAVTFGFFFLLWQQRNRFNRNHGIAKPLNQIVNNLQQLSKSDKSQSINTVSGTNSVMSCAKSIESDKKEIKDLLTC